MTRRPSGFTPHVTINTTPPTKRTTSSPVRWIHRSITAFLATVMLILGGSGAASANILDWASGVFTNAVGGVAESAACGWAYKDPETWQPGMQPWPGGAGLIGLATRDLNGSRNVSALASDDLDSIYRKYTEPYGNTPVTAYEWWGTAGLTWNEVTDPEITPDCPILSTIGNGVSGMLWSATSLVGELGITMYSFGMGIDPITPFLDVIGEVLEAIRDQFAGFISLIVVLGTLSVGWQIIIKRRMSVGFAGIAWMVGAIAVGTVVLAAPTTYLKGTVGFVNDVKGTITNSVTGVVTPKSNLCALPAGAPDRALRSTQCMLWQSYLYTPWAMGQFGPLAGADNVTGEDGKKITATLPGGRTYTQLPVVYLDTFTKNHDEVIRGTSDTSIDRPARWAAITATIRALDKGEPPTSSDEATTTDVTYSTGLARSYNGLDWQGRMSAALVGMFGAIVGMGGVTVLSLMNLALQVALLMLFLLLGLVAILGIHPGFGRRIATKWAEMIASNIIKQIVLTFMIAIVTVISGVILQADSVWVLQVALVGLVSFGALIYRKTLIENVARVNLGEGGGGSSGNASGKAKQMLSQASVATGNGRIQGGGLGSAAALTGLGVLAGRGRRGRGTTSPRFPATPASASASASDTTPTDTTATAGGSAPTTPDATCSKCGRTYQRVGNVYRCPNCQPSNTTSGPSNGTPAPTATTGSPTPTVLDAGGLTAIERMNRGVGSGEGQWTATQWKQWADTTGQKIPVPSNASHMVELQAAGVQISQWELRPGFTASDFRTAPPAATPTTTPPPAPTTPTTAASVLNEAAKTTTGTAPSTAGRPSTAAAAATPDKAAPVSGVPSLTPPGKPDGVVPQLGRPGPRTGTGT